jgi:hypothetical protein
MVALMVDKMALESAASLAGKKVVLMAGLTAVTMAAYSADQKADERVV